MMRIRGLVKATNYVKSQLKQGIQPSEMASLQKFVLDSLQTVEAICQEAQTSPLKLPTRSRQAYLYLKSIDWQNLPQTPPQPKIAPTPKTLHLKNVVKQQNQLHQQIQNLPPNYTQTQLNSLRQLFQTFAGDIKKICQQNQVSPAALATPSRKA
ncbi:MAG: topoisomerase II, partial [Spirulinaceae cyanobacterium]